MNCSRVPSPKPTAAVDARPAIAPLRAIPGIQVKAGRALQDAIKDMLTASAELLVLWRKQKGM